MISKEKLFFSVVQIEGNVFVFIGSVRANRRLLKIEEIVRKEEKFAPKVSADLTERAAPSLGSSPTLFLS